MTDSDDKVARRYRSLAREEPGIAVDGAILAAAHRKVRSRPGIMRWAGPVSIAAVLVLGIGVSLRMQLEKPGIETAPPENEYSMPKSAELLATPDAAPANSAPSFEQKFNDLAGGKRAQDAPAKLAAPKPALAPAPLEERAKDRADADRTEGSNVIASPGAMAPIAPPAAMFVPAPAPAAPPPPARAEIDVASRAAEAPAATGAVQRAPMPQAQLAAPRAKKEAAADTFGARELNKAVAADPERDRELERIAKLREAGQQAEADRALEAFRKRYPDFRIPEPMWQRVRPR